MSGRVVDASGGRAKVELGEGVFAFAKLPEERQEAAASAGKSDLSALTAMLSQKWKSGGSAQASSEGVRAGQIRSFKIVALNAEQKKIELEL